MSNRYNWKAIEKDYIAGELTISDISDKYKIDKGYLHREAKKRNWVRAKVKKSTAPKLIDNAFISEIAKEKYEAIKSKMGDTLTELDDIALIPLCNQYARMINLEQVVLKEGVTIISSKGVPYANPNYNALLTTVKTVASLSKELGLTVSSRKKIGVVPKSDSKKDDIFDIASITEEIDV